MDALGFGREIVDDRGVAVVPAALLAFVVAVLAAARAEVIALGSFPIGTASAATLFDKKRPPALARGGPSGLIQTGRLQRL